MSVAVIVAPPLFVPVSVTLWLFNTPLVNVPVVPPSAPIATLLVMSTVLPAPLKSFVPKARVLLFASRAVTSILNAVPAVFVATGSRTTKKLASAPGCTVNAAEAVATPSVAVMVAPPLLVPVSVMLWLSKTPATNAPVAPPPAPIATVLVSVGVPV